MNTSSTYATRAQCNAIAARISDTYNVTCDVQPRKAYDGYNGFVIFLDYGVACHVAETLPMTNGMWLDVVHGAALAAYRN
jgi:hypothetical protein